MNKLLQRQIEKFLRDVDSLPRAFEPLFDAISDAYDSFDEDRHLIERALDISSEELTETNRKLRQEVSEHKETEEELRKTEEKYRIQFEGALDAIFVADAETGILLDCNPAATRLVGMEKSELIGKSHRILHPPEKFEEEFSRIFKKHFEEQKNQTLETQVVTKTGEIKDVAIKANLLDVGGKRVLQGIFRDITEHKQAQEKLVDAAHKAGMAEVATDVLHNVKNVLNSISVSTTMIKEKLSNSELTNLKQLADIINENTDDLGTFFTKDPRSKHIPVYLNEVSKMLMDEQTDILKRMHSLAENVQHIKDIVSMQQTYAKTSGVEMPISLAELIEDAIQINSQGLQRHRSQLIRELEELPAIEIDKQKVLQILVNLINNAKYALSDSDKEEKILTVRLYKHDEDRIRIEVADNGIGISKENLTKIFNHGFTTKKHGHGFGLHSGAMAAKEMGGSLTVHSDGIGKGSTFTLELPFKQVMVMS